MSEVPDLDNISPSDLDYLDKINNNNDAIESAFNSVANDLAVVQSDTGFQAFNDIYVRQISSSDATHGVIGPYSFVFSDLGGGVVALLHQNASGSSSCVIQGEYKVESRSTQIDLDTLGFSDGTYTLYVGVNADTDTNGVTISASTLSTQIALPLYSFQGVLSAGAWTISQVMRFPRTLLFDNTWFQLEQERPRYEGSVEQNTFSDASDWILTIPYPHVIHRLFNSVFNATPSSGISITVEYYYLTSSTTETLIGETTFSTSSSDIYGSHQSAPSSPYGNQVMPAFSTYHMDCTVNTGDSEDGLQIGMLVFPSYNVQTI